MSMTWRAMSARLYNEVQADAARHQERLDKESGVSRNSGGGGGRVKLSQTPLCVYWSRTNQIHTGMVA